ncbi:3820_t:CDS:2, partial [Gigaspora rosea]
TSFFWCSGPFPFFAAIWCCYHGGGFYNFLVLLMWWNLCRVIVANGVNSYLGRIINHDNEDITGLNVLETPVVIP